MNKYFSKAVTHTNSNIPSKINTEKAIYQSNSQRPRKKSWKEEKIADFHPKQ